MLALPLPAFAGDLSKKAHTDLCVGFTFKPPAGWKGVPPESKYLGEGDITAGASSEGKDVRICEYRDLKIGESVHIRVYYLGGTRGNLDRAESVFQTALSNWYNPDSFGQSKTVKVGRAAAKQFMAECGRGATIRGTVLAMDKRAIGIVERWYEKTPLAAIEVMHKSVRTVSIIPKSRLGSMRARYGKTVILSDWGTLKTRYYDIDYNTDKDFVKKLADHMQAMQGLYRKLFPTLCSKIIPSS